MTVYAIVTVSIAVILVVVDAEAIVYYVSMGDNPLTLTPAMLTDFAKAKPTSTALPVLYEGGNKKIDQALKLVAAMVENPGKGPAGVEYRFVFGTPLQRRVWAYLEREAAPGTTLSYAQIAEALGMPKSSRVVANACGANRLAVVVPCHRVLTKSGKNSGYRWGIARKEALLQREAVRLRFEGFRHHPDALPGGVAVPL